MRYDHPQERLSSIADEYVLGTLTRRARRRFERVLDGSDEARAAVRAAEDGLLSLGDLLEPVPPAAATWTAIRVRLGFDGAAPAATARRGFGAGWRIAFAVTITAVALALGWLVYRDARLETVPVATLRAEGGPDLWHVELDRDTTRLAVRVAQATPAPAGKSYELWALPAGAAPVSLGLLPVAGDIERRLEPAQRSALEAASKVAVSLEPAGGSQTGAPTGPVLYVAEIDRAAG